MTSLETEDSFRFGMGWKFIFLALIFVGAAQESVADQVFPLRRGFGQVCYEVLQNLSHLGFRLREPKVTPKASVESQLNAFSGELERAGWDAEDAAIESRIRYLAKLGYEESLVRRWQSVRPEFVEEVVYHPNNRPLVGFHGISVSPSGYRVRSDSSGTYYFSFAHVVARDFARTENDRIGIIERIQIPNFAWHYKMSQISYYTFDLPLSWPALNFAGEPALFVSHVQVPSHSPSWHSFEDGQALLSALNQQ